MTTITIRTINSHGKQEILEFLRKNHRYCAGENQDFFSEEMLHAWAGDAEFQMEEGNPPTIEIPAHNANYGHAIEFRISDAGVDSNEMEVE